MENCQLKQCAPQPPQTLDSSLFSAGCAIVFEVIKGSQILNEKVK